MKVTRAAAASIICIMLAGCGGADSKIAELQASNEQLSQRVKAVEAHLLEAEKKLIAHQLAMQTLNTRQKEMENYFNKMQVGQSYR